MKAFKNFTLPNRISLCRVTRKIVATIETFKKFILQGILLEKWWHCVGKFGKEGLERITLSEGLANMAGVDVRTSE
jgi:hypothetical protein